jgi:hypothetical protein
MKTILDAAIRSILGNNDYYMYLFESVEEIIFMHTLFLKLGIKVFETDNLQVNGMV